MQKSKQVVKTLRRTVVSFQEMPDDFKQLLSVEQKKDSTRQRRSQRKMKRQLPENHNVF